MSVCSCRARSQGRAPRVDYPPGNGEPAKVDGPAGAGRSCRTDISRPMARIGARGRRTYGYTAYGLIFERSVSLPGLPAAAAGIPADVVVRHGDASPRRLDAPVAQRRALGCRARAASCFAAVAARGGFWCRRVRSPWSANPAPRRSVLARCFTKEVLPVVLRQRGLLVLHANAALTPGGWWRSRASRGRASRRRWRRCSSGAARCSPTTSPRWYSAAGRAGSRCGPGSRRCTSRRRRSTVSATGFAPGWSSRGDRSSPRWPPVRAWPCHAGRLSAIYLLSTHDGAGVQLLAAEPDSRGSTPCSAASTGRCCPASIRARSRSSGR